MIRSSWKILGPLLVLWVGCGGKQPVYDSELGLTAIPVEAGALDGRFALRVRTNAMADLSFLGNLESITDSYWILTRSYDEETETYEETADFCTSVNYEIAGMTTTVLPGAYDQVPNVVTKMILDHETCLLYTSDAADE